MEVLNKTMSTNEGRETWMNVTVGNTMESIRILQPKLFLSFRGVIGDILVGISYDHELGHYNHSSHARRHRGIVSNVGVIHPKMTLMD